MRGTVLLFECRRTPVFFVPPVLVAAAVVVIVVDEGAGSLADSTPTPNSYHTVMVITGERLAT